MTGTLEQVQRCVEVANAAMVDAGHAPTFTVWSDERGHFAASFPTDRTARDEYRALTLGAIAVGRHTVPCFTHWRAQDIHHCPRITTAEALTYAPCLESRDPRPC